MNSYKQTMILLGCVLSFAFSSVLVQAQGDVNGVKGDLSPIETASAIQVTFNVDMSEEANNGNFSNSRDVYVRGSFTNWGVSSDFMLSDDDSDMIYNSTFTLESDSVHEYKFYHADPGDLTNGAWEDGENRILTLNPADTTLPVFMFGDHSVTVTISEARSMALSGDTSEVTVVGRVTTPDYGFNNGVFFIQDNDAGIKVYYPGMGQGNDTPFVEGQEVAITGKPILFNEEVEIEAISYTIYGILGLPEAISIPTSDIAPESPYQGMRVRTEPFALTSESPWPETPIDSGSGVLTYFTNENGDTVEVFIDRGESYYDGSPRPEGTFYIEGALSRYNDRVQILPFFEFDLEPAAGGSPIDVTFHVDMNELANDGKFDLSDNVYVNGSFNGWWPPGEDHIMTDANGDFVYDITLTMEGNSYYEYKFYYADETAPEQGNWEIGENRILETNDANMDLPVFMFGDQNNGVTIQTLRDMISAGDTTSVTIEGTVNTPDYGFNNGVFFIQDSTAGIKVYYPGMGQNNGTPFQPGQVVAVTGNGMYFNEEMQISATSHSILMENQNISIPRDIAIDELTVDSPYQGMRVRLAGLTLKSDSPWPETPQDGGAGMSTFFEDDSGQVVEVYIDRGESYFDGTHRPSGKVNIEGSMGRYQDNTLVLPFFDFEIESAGSPPPPVSLDFPITFEEGIEWDLVLNNFAGGFAEVVGNPDKSGINGTDSVLKFVKNEGEPWAGSFLHMPQALETTENFAITAQVWAPRENTKMVLKIENQDNMEIFADQEKMVPAAQTWTEMTFDLSSVDLDLEYHKIVFFFDLESVGDGSTDYTWYVDELRYDTVPFVETQLTFQVDMSVQAQMDNFSPTDDDVFVRGSFNDWTADANSVMSDANEDLVYDITLPVQGNMAHEYKFYTSRGDWEITENRLVEVDTQDVVLPVVFFSDQSEILDPQEVSIADAKNMPINEYVTIHGVLSTPDFGFNEALFYMQDETAGIKVYSPDWGGINRDTPFSAGDSVEITGFVGVYNGESEVVGDDYINHGHVGIPEAIHVGIEEVHPTSIYAGMRIKVNDLMLWNPEEWPTNPIEGPQVRVGAEHVPTGTGLNVLIRGVTSYFDGSPVPEENFDMAGTLSGYNPSDGDSTAVLGEILPFFEWDIYTTMGESIEMPRVVALPGDQILVPVNVIFNRQAYSSVEISFDGFQQDLNFLEVVTDSGAVNEYGWQTMVNNTDSLVITASAGDMAIDGEHTLFYLKFEVPEDIDVQYVGIWMSEIFVDEEYFMGHIMDGEVEIIELMAGDVSLNGDIRAFDAALILKHLTEMIQLDEYQRANADVTSDNTISTLDASTILEYVVKLINQLPVESAPAEFAGNGELSMESQVAAPGEMVEIPLVLSKADNIKGFQGSIEFDTTQLVFDEVVWDEAVDGYQIEYALKGNKVLFAGAGVGSKAFDGNFGHLKFTTTSSLDEAGTRVALKDLRWNEGDIISEASAAYVAPTITALNGFRERPSTFELKANYPNPFNPSTQIEYGIPLQSHVKVEIFNMLGQRVATLVNAQQEAGYHTLTFEAGGLSSGIYIYRMQAGSFTETRKMLLVK